MMLRLLQQQHPRRSPGARTELGFVKDSARRTAARYFTTLVHQTVDRTELVSVLVAVCTNCIVYTWDTRVNPLAIHVQRLTHRHAVTVEGEREAVE